MASYYFATDSCQVEIEADTLDAASREYAAGEGIAGVSTMADLEAYMERAGGYMTVTEGGVVVAAAK